MNIDKHNISQVELLLFIFVHYKSDGVLVMCLLPWKQTQTKALLKTLIAVHIH